MDYKDYYKMLGVERDASADAIKKAYRKLVRKHHPDLSKSADADHKTKEVNEAYAVLGDPEKKAAYDALGKGAQAGRPFQPPPGWGAHYAGAARAGDGVEDMGDLFADLFAHVGRRSQARPQYRQRGEDVHATMAIGLADAYQGGKFAVSLDGQEIEVQVPRGVTAGQQLRLAGKGRAGGAGPGDLYLEIQFKPDPRYRVDGREVSTTVPVAPWEAALGADIDVPTPSGTVQVKVPPGSQSGRRLRLKGRGIPGHPAGDLYLTLEVVLPPANNDKARALYAAMARELAFDPRAQVRG